MQVRFKKNGQNHLGVITNAHVIQDWTVLRLIKLGSTKKYDQTCTHWDTFCSMGEVISKIYPSHSEKHRTFVHFLEITSPMSFHCQHFTHVLFVKFEIFNEFKSRRHIFLRLSLVQSHGLPSGWCNHTEYKPFH